MTVHKIIVDKINLYYCVQNNSCQIQNDFKQNECRQNKCRLND